MPLIKHDKKSEKMAFSTGIVYSSGHWPSEFNRIFERYTAVFAQYFQQVNKVLIENTIVNMVQCSKMRRTDVE